MTEPFEGAAAAFLRYESVRARLPRGRFATSPDTLPSLAETADRYDGFLLDAFGVLNVGETAIPGAVARIAELRALSKRVCVLSNAASSSREGLLAKYHRLGFDFTAAEVLSSRDVALAWIEHAMPGARLACIAATGDPLADVPGIAVDAIADPSAFDTSDAVLFLSTERWTPARQLRLTEAMSRASRPLIVANPDIVAPREDTLSLEPGHFAHTLLDGVATQTHWFGKPFPDAFDQAIARTGLSPDRLAMVGDTLHTDVLGGAAAGCGTILVTAHGLFRGLDVEGYIARSGIVPDIVVETT